MVRREIERSGMWHATDEDLEGVALLASQEPLDVDGLCRPVFWFAETACRDADEGKVCGIRIADGVVPRQRSGDFSGGLGKCGGQVVKESGEENERAREQPALGRQG